MDEVSIILISWILFSSIVAFLGSTRKIGAMGAFAASIVLSPLIGFLVVIFSKPVPKEFNTLQEISVSDEISKLNTLYNDGVLTKEEFDIQKSKVLNSGNMDSVKVNSGSVKRDLQTLLWAVGIFIGALIIFNLIMYFI